VIFAEDQPATHIVLVENGVLALARTSRDGRELILGIRSAGALVGTSAVLLGERHSASAITLSASHVRVLPSEDFLDAVRADPNLSAEIQRRLSGEIHEQRDRMSALVFDSARQRLEDFLRALAPAGAAPKPRVQLPYAAM
jgi:CRP-like cAMP-binding protein